MQLGVHYRVRIKKYYGNWKYYPEIWRWYWPWWCSMSTFECNDMTFYESYFTEKEAWDIIRDHQSGMVPDSFVYKTIEKEKK